MLQKHSSAFTLMEAVDRMRRMMIMLIADLQDRVQMQALPVPWHGTSDV